MGFGGVEISGFQVWVLGFGVRGLKIGVQILGIGDLGSGFGVCLEREDDRGVAFHPFRPLLLAPDDLLAPHFIKIQHSIPTWNSHSVSHSCSVCIQILHE